jgi:anhydro-N-acetylmuramic acid kinase
MRVIGMMSGTSADGIDAVVVQLEGQPPALQWKLEKHIHLDHPQELQAAIFAGFRPETGSVDRLCALNFAIGEAFARAALAVIAAAGLSLQDVDLIGSHGQSLWHIPFGPEASTLQLGEAAVIAERTGITTINNFRTRDMAAGGQGAPLVSYIDLLLFSHPERNRVLQNIGGIANLTYLPDAARRALGDSPFALDTGPGNMLMDYSARRATDGALQYDRNGAIAAQGKVDEELLAAWLQREAYFSLKPPKTTGPELFGAQYGVVLWADAQARKLSHADTLATVTAFTARSIANAYRDFLPAPPDEVIVSGGGAFNPVLMKMLSELAAPARVCAIDELGLGSDAKEATAFAVLAYETWHNRPGNLPPATGARRAVVLGSITPGDNFARLRHGA